MDDKRNEPSKNVSSKRPLAELANTAKKVSLYVGTVFFGILAAFFFLPSQNMNDADIGANLFTLYLGTGPLLTAIIMGRALTGKKSKKLLIALGAWFALFILLFIILIIETTHYGSYHL